MNSASARLEAFPKAFDEKIRRRLGPELGPLDFTEELFIDVAADVSLGGVALIGHKGFPSISISDCATAWRNVVHPSRRTGFITREPLARVCAIRSPCGMASFFFTFFPSLLKAISRPGFLRLFCMIKKLSFFFFSTFISRRVYS